MFTGMISDVGEVIAVEPRGDLAVRIACDYDVGAIPMGASIACDGICLTVVSTGTDPAPWFEVEISAESVSRTALKDRPWEPGRRVNLERSLRVGDELGGHIVAGHVDGVGRIEETRDEGGSTRFTISAPGPLMRFLAEKGSVALNGTSLTVNEVGEGRFGVNLIAHSKSVTTWGDLAAGDPVNIEVDTVARYVARLAETH